MIIANAFCYIVHFTRTSMYIGYWTLNKYYYYYIYILSISEGGEFWIKGRYIFIYMSEGGGWNLTKQLGNVIIMLGLVGLFN